MITTTLVGLLFVLESSLFETSTIVEHINYISFYKMNNYEEDNILYDFNDDIILSMEDEFFENNTES